MRLLSQSTRTRRKGRPKGRGGVVRGERGVALIMVTAVIAILTAVAVEFTYRERVNMHLAANARDELRAYYLAKSAVNLSRLVLSFQSQVDQLGGNLSGLLGNLQNNPQLASLLGATSGGDLSSLTGLLPQGGANQANGQGGGLGIRLWELIPVDCGMVQMLAALGGGETEVNESRNPDPNAPQLTPFGDFQGGCSAEITDEDSKINVNQLNGLQRQTQAAVLSLMSLMQDPRYDFLFDEDDSHGIRMNRQEMLIALRDYVDEDETQQTLMMGAQGPELLPGSGDETYYYNRYEPRYKPKNAPLDSLDELYQIAGVGDYFMSAFGDRLTVYTDKNSKLNVTPQNMADLQLRVVLAAQDPQRAVTLATDPAFMTNLWDQLQLQRAMMPWIGLQPATFKSLLEANGIVTNTLAFSGSSALFGTSSRTFTIKATGQAGDVEKTIVAVVRMDGPDPMGRLLHWEEK